jgi:hypothetical protein
MSWYNPKTWLSKKAAPAVYVGVNPEHPSVGISVIAEVKPEGGSFCVEGIPFGKAKLDLCGKVLDWDKVPAKYIAAFKGGVSIPIQIDRLQSFFR